MNQERKRGRECVDSRSGRTAGARKKICGCGYNEIMLHGPEARRVDGGGVLIHNDKEHDKTRCCCCTRTGGQAAGKANW